MSEPLTATPADLTRLARHKAFVNSDGEAEEWCEDCGKVWPCWYGRLHATIAALRTQLEQAQQEIRRFEEAIREHNEHCPEYEEGIEHIEGIPVR